MKKENFVRQILYTKVKTVNNVAHLIIRRYCNVMKRKNAYNTVYTSQFNFRQEKQIKLNFV